MDYLFFKKYPNYDELRQLESSLGEVEFSLRIGNQYAGYMTKLRHNSGTGH